MSTLAKRLIGEAKKPYWERDAEKRHKDQVAHVKAVYGQDKAEPDPRQAKLIRLYWRRGEHKKMMDYCWAKGLNPNNVIKKYNEEGHRDE